jgi:hypothetical protein
MNPLSLCNKEIDAILQTSSHPEIDLFQYYTSKSEENKDAFVLALIGRVILDSAMKRCRLESPEMVDQRKGYQDIHDHIRETEQNPRRAKALERARQKLAGQEILFSVEPGLRPS